VKRHNYTVNGTKQIGSAEFIAAATGKIVISDFRQADIALGGEGAPITTFAVEKLFTSDKEPRLIINIGGMSNYFYLPVKKSGKSVQAEDCGPGNSIIDILAQKLYKENYDKNGSHAQKGKISERLLLLLLNNVYFKSSLKSTGRELFGHEFADKIMAFGKEFKLTKYDLMATATDFTARSIALSTQKLIKKDKMIEKLYLTGGGRKNIFLLKQLSHHLPNVTILPIDNIGINGDYLEAASFAVLGWAAVTSQPLNIYGSRKRKLKPVSGRIIQPPQ
jgi:anhydro-N-acetylmuramic acid kinase